MSTLSDACTKAGVLPFCFEFPTLDCRFSIVFSRKDAAEVISHEGLKFFELEIAACLLAVPHHCFCRAVILRRL